MRNAQHDMTKNGHSQRKALFEFIAAQSFAVAATNCANASPESALLGIAVTPELEIIFETTEATRKCANLRRDPRISFVIGWVDERTLQYEGVADEPASRELEKLKECFFAAHPDLRAHEQWPGLTYFRVKPRWIRFSSYYRPRLVEEISFDA